MTRRDYVLIAGALKTARAKLIPYPAQAVGCDTATHELAQVLGKTNPRFDRTRFLAAAGVPVL